MKYLPALFVSLVLTASIAFGQQVLSGVQMAGVSLSVTEAAVEAVISDLEFDGGPGTVLPAGTTSTLANFSTDQPADCKIDNSPGVAYASMSNTMQTTGGFLHQEQFFALVDDTSYTVYAKCQTISDSIINASDFPIAWSVAASGPDVTAPTLSNGLPTGEQVFNITTVTLSVDTDETATCRYGTNGPGTEDYATKPNPFTNTNSFFHTEPGVLADNNTAYTYYVICQDAAANESAETTISFSVAAADTTVPNLTNPIPSGNLAAGTASPTTLGISTLNEPDGANCRVSTINESYAAMGAGKEFDTTDVLPPNGHTTSVTHGGDGTTTNYYVACQDTSANTSATLLVPVKINNPALVDCTDGVDCFCDRQIAADGAAIVACEDFEDPALPIRDNDAGLVWQRIGGTRQGTGDWMDLYGQTGNQCMEDENLATYWTHFCKGDSDCCADIVDETTATFSDGGCGVSGDSDCVLDGTYSLANQFQQGKTNYNLGKATWTGGAQRTFGFTMGMKYSTNYVRPGSGGTSGPAHKNIEFGAVNAGLAGVGSTGNGVPRNMPWRGFTNVGQFGSNNYTVLVGQLVHMGGKQYAFGIDSSGYDFDNGVGDGRGNWQCLQIHWANWGTSNATARAWMNGNLVWHVINIDMSSLISDQSGIGSHIWNSYYNGHDNSGYDAQGNGVAYMYVDNVVVTTDPEPVSCGDIGM